MDEKIQPDRITKPIQLLGAWLAGLLSIDSCFLIAATRFPVGSWESEALAIAAIINVPPFLIAVFLLQTKFRPELQEDLYYSSYINQKRNAPIQLSKEEVSFLQIQQRLEKQESLRLRLSTTEETQLDTHSNLTGLKFGINHHLLDKENIAKRLGKIGVTSYSTFGVDEAPEHRAIAVSQGLPFEVERQVLRLASELGFKKFSYIEPVEQNVIEENVLFGSYGIAEREITVPQL